MKEALTLFMLAILVLPLLIGVRRIRRLPRPPEAQRHDGSADQARHGPDLRD